MPVNMIAFALAGLCTLAFLIVGVLFVAGACIVSRRADDALEAYGAGQGKPE